MSVDFNKPIFCIIGAARSGTTYLASLLADEKVAYIEEPNVIWMHRNCRSTDDVLLASDATIKVKSYIRLRFSEYLDRTGCEILLEKTPANCFRLPFIEEVFPNVKYIFVFRDINDIAASAEKKWINEEDSNTARLYGKSVSHRRRQIMIQFRKFLMLHPIDYVGYFDKMLEEILFYLLGVKRRFWGPRYPGMMTDVKTVDVSEICKRQAIISQEYIRDFMSTLPASRYMRIDYRDLVRYQEECVKLVKHFIGINNRSGAELYGL